jgi:uncharacterized protein YecA (UPF0149 family)
METIKRKRQRFNALLYYAKMREAKEGLLAGYNAESTSELTEQQLDELIERVQAIIDEKGADADKIVRQWRHKCLRMIAECKVNTQDWNAVNAFMMDPRIAGKLIPELSLNELQALHRKLHNVRDEIIKKEKALTDKISQN